MNIEDLMDEIDNDLDLDECNLDTKLHRIPMLHNKYARLWFKSKGKLDLLNSNLAVKYRERWYYYKHDFEYTIDQKHIEWHIESDEEYIKIQSDVNRQKRIVSFLEQTIKKINAMSFDIKNIIEYKKFMNGLV